MGISADGVLFYGWLFEEGYNLPWGEDVDKWWMKINGYKLPDNIDEDTQYHYRMKWRSGNPIPFVVGNYYSMGRPIYALAAKVLLTGRKGVVEIDDMEIDYKVILKIRKICEDHGVNLCGEPKWWLASYWDKK